MFEQLGLIGCGLMGGSFALAMKEAGLVQQVVGYSKSPSTLERARQMGVIDVEAPSALLAVSGADIVLLAVPVSATEDSFKAMRHLLQPHTLVMDVGSTKCDVVDAGRRALREHIGNFVPAHPIAGKEVSGVEHADASLYKGRQVILTPLPETHPKRLQQAIEVWSALGAQLRQMTPQAHDRAYAAVSHLPHLVAFAAINAIAGQPEAAAFLQLAGPGFKDFTRIAASEPSVWRDILLANRTEILSQSQRLRQALDQLEAHMQSGNGQALQTLIEQASACRSGWPGPAGPLSPAPSPN